ncbi:unnamed protein product [Bursaphelenchus xylophilus]|uniref:(pine wood nematode) hypothetical protein n=1 Tax=Bursaphelenchus xylophilus TaxID=6326 RepID=A0A1I7SXA9_BURXY|nr:unnamed protein product [Bursaphelenchus xylophilus]CAG9100296.1 unnamed protein product [Bursaphelenchus xylophilus]
MEFIKKLATSLYGHFFGLSPETNKKMVDEVERERKREGGELGSEPVDAATAFYEKVLMEQLVKEFENVQQNGRSEGDVDKIVNLLEAFPDPK